jgi:hypothetical protein
MGLVRLKMNWGRQARRGNAANVCGKVVGGGMVLKVLLRCRKDAMLKVGKANDRMTACGAILNVSLYTSDCQRGGGYFDEGVFLETGERERYEASAVWICC